MVKGMQGEKQALLGKGRGDKEVLRKRLPQGEYNRKQGQVSLPKIAAYVHILLPFQELN
jgi:hypothetical protein